MDKLKTKPEEALMNAFGFDEDDLEANRNGKLSLYQIRLLRRERCRWLLITTLVSMIIALVSIVGVLGVPGEFLSFLYAALCHGIPIGVFLLYILLRWGALNTEIHQNAVADIEGRVQLDVIEQSLTGIKYRVRITDLSFKISKYCFLAFKNGDPYIIYFTPLTRRILSVEWLC